jgi:hypothetical protein
MTSLQKNGREAMATGKGRKVSGTDSVVPWRRPCKRDSAFAVARGKLTFPRSCASFALECRGCAPTVDPAFGRRRSVHGRTVNRTFSFSMDIDFFTAFGLERERRSGQRGCKQLARPTESSCSACSVCRAMNYRVRSSRGPPRESGARERARPLNGMRSRGAGAPAGPLLLDRQAIGCADRLDHGAKSICATLNLLVKTRRRPEMAMPSIVSSSARSCGEVGMASTVTSPVGVILRMALSLAT